MNTFDSIQHGKKPRIDDLVRSSAGYDDGALRTRVLRDGTPKDSSLSVRYGGSVRDGQAWRQLHSPDGMGMRNT